MNISGRHAWMAKLATIGALWAVLSLTAPANADEGMWTFDNPPARQLQERYGFTIERPTLKDKIMIESSSGLSNDELDSHLPLAGLLIGRRLG